jgi:hypothetical protein
MKYKLAIKKRIEELEHSPQHIESPEALEDWECALLDSQRISFR